MTGAASILVRIIHVPQCGGLRVDPAGIISSIVQEVFGFVKKNLSGAQRRKGAVSGERGAGKGAAALVPAQAAGFGSICPAVDRRLAVTFVVNQTCTP